MGATLLGCLIACLIITLGASSAKAQNLGELVGGWLTRGGHERAGRPRIGCNYDNQDRLFGQGRITTAVDWATNYVIVYPGDRRGRLNNNNTKINVEVQSPIPLRRGESWDNSQHVLTAATTT
jgi:hypothetical protein